MLDKIASIILVIVGIINIIPVIVFFDSGYAWKLYGISLEDETLTLLMRHRGVLLSIVGIALIVAAFKPEHRIFAITLAFISKITFLYLFMGASNYVLPLKQVAFADVLALIGLLGVLGIQFWSK